MSGVMILFAFAMSLVINFVERKVHNKQDASKPLESNTEYLVKDTE